MERNVTITLDYIAFYELKQNGNWRLLIIFSSYIFSVAIVGGDRMSRSLYRIAPSLREELGDDDIYEWVSTETKNFINEAWGGKWEN